MDQWLANEMNITRTKGPDAQSCGVLATHLEAGKR
jgi:hypothetical protein